MKAVRERRKFNLPPRPSSTLDIYRLPSPLISCKGQDCERKKAALPPPPISAKKEKEICTSSSSSSSSFVLFLPCRARKT